MINTQVKILYNNEIEITFYPDSHRYKLKGEKSYLTSVTSITGIIDKSRVLIDWALRLTKSHLSKFLEESRSNQFTTEELLPIIDEAINQHNIKRDEAADTGSQVHDIALKIGEALKNKENIETLPEDLSEEVKNGVHAFIDWILEHKVKFIECERLVYSKEHKFVGITDAVIEVDGKRYLIDYKTSKGIYNEMKYQVAAYTIAYQEETGINLDGQMLIHFNKDTGEFKIHEIDQENNLINQQTFLHCLAIKNREKELSKI